MLPKVMQVGRPVLHFGDMFAGGCVEMLSTLWVLVACTKLLKLVYVMHVSLSHDSQQLLLH